LNTFAGSFLIGELPDSVKTCCVVCSLSAIQEYKREANIQANNASHDVKPPDYRIIRHSAVCGRNQERPHSSERTVIREESRQAH